MPSVTIDYSSLRDIKRSSFHDSDGILLESAGCSVFITYEVADRIVAFQKESYVFVSQTIAERMVTKLKSLVDNSEKVSVADKTFIVGLWLEYRKKIEFTATQKKNLKSMYEKYVGFIKKEDENIPF